MAQLGNLVVNGVARMLSKLYVNDSVTAPTFVGALSGNATTATTASKLGTNAGNTTTPVYFSNGVPVALGYTIATSVPSGAKFTDTDTWRGIQDNLTSSSTSDSLSANQGKVLKGLVDGKAASNHTHKYASGFSVSGTTVTVSYGDGTTSTFKTQDTNTTYGVFKAATASAAGGTGLVPAPAAGAQGKYLRADGTWSTPPDTNTTYPVFKGATASAAGGNGLVPAPAKGAESHYLAGDSTWKAFSKSTVGLGNVDNTADSAKSVKYATSAGSANSVAWGNVTGKPSTFAPSAHTHNYAGSASAGGSATSAVGVVDYGSTAKTIKIGYGGDGITGDNIKYIAGYTTGDGANVTAKIKDVSKDALKGWLGLGSAAYTASSNYARSSHTHNYAGSSSAGGSANSAVKLDTATAGSATQPVYFANGKPTACTYTLGKSVPSNAVFTDTVTLTLANRINGTVVTCDAIPTT